MAAGKPWLLWLTLMAAAVLPAQAQQVFYVHTDALGSVVAVTDANGDVVKRSEYEPYGRVLNRPVTNGPGYTGHVEDAATGLTYMQQRYYDPAIGRFLSVDPVTADGNTGGNFNRYWYANDNPYRFTDPDGRLPVLQIAGGVAGGIIGGGASLMKGNDLGTVLKDTAVGVGVGVLSTIPGGGAIAVGLRAGLASGAGDVVSQAVDNGVANVDLTQSATQAVIGGLTGGLAKGGVDKLIPNRAIPGLPSSHPLVREGRAMAQSGSEATTAPLRDATEVAGAAVIGGSVAVATALSSQSPLPNPEPKP